MIRREKESLYKNIISPTTSHVAISPTTGHMHLCITKCYFNRMLIIIIIFINTDERDEIQHSLVCVSEFLLLVLLFAMNAHIIFHYFLSVVRTNSLILFQICYTCISRISFKNLEKCPICQLNNNCMSLCHKQIIVTAELFFFCVSTIF